MRVLHVIRSLNLAGGGPPIVAASLAAGEAMHGHDVRLAGYFAAEGNADSGNTLRALREQVPAWDKVASIDLGALGTIEKITSRRARTLLEAQIAEVDIVHLHGVWEPLLAAAGTIARRRGCPYLVTPHGMLKTWAMQLKPLKKRIALHLGRRTLLNGAAALHVLNEEEAQVPQSLRLTAPRFILPNGAWPIDPASLPPMGAFRREYPQLGDDPFILLVSRLIMHKGLDLLVDAFARVLSSVPNARLVLVGPLSADVDAVRAQARGAGVENRLLIIPGLFGQAKLSCMREAAVFCLPSRNEGFPVVVIESLGLGVPAVVSDRCFVPQVESAGAGYVVPLDANPLAERLQRILTDPTLRAEMGRRALQLAQGSFSWDRIGAQMVDAYTQAMGSQRAIAAPRPTA